MALEHKRVECSCCDECWEEIDTGIRHHFKGPDGGEYFYDLLSVSLSNYLEDNEIKHGLTFKLEDIGALHGRRLHATSIYHKEQLLLSATPAFLYATGSTPVLHSRQQDLTLSEWLEFCRAFALDSLANALKGGAKCV